MSVIEVNDDSFQSQVFETSQLVVVEFSRPGFNSFGEPDNSTRTGAILNQVAPEYEGRVKILRVPMDSCEATVEEFGVEGAPTIIFFRNDKELERVTDFHLKAWFRTRINELLSSE